MGLVLEWVYGTIVSTAEKARDGAKRSLGAAPARFVVRIGMPGNMRISLSAFCLGSTAAISLGV